jgi:hypothetical protein
MTSYKLNDSTRLSFNADRGVYETTLLLKQGFYSYTYVTMDQRSAGAKPSNELTDGDYFETEDTYTVLVYYKSLSGRHDELVGTVSLNSRSNQFGY